MYQDVTNFKPLFLSEEETMALLDLCLTSPTEIDEVKEQAIRKLTDLARNHISDAIQEERTEPVSGDSAALFAAVIAAPASGETLRHDARIAAQETLSGDDLSPFIMTARAMAHSRAPRRHLDTALADSRRRLRRHA
jgi:hypothetical protein